MAAFFLGFGAGLMVGAGLLIMVVLGLAAGTDKAIARGLRW